MEWQATIKGFEAYMLLERSLSKHSINAYQEDVKKLRAFIIERYPDKHFKDVNYKILQEFIQWLAPRGLEARSQARILSGIRSFFGYLILENIIEDDPSELLEGPKLPKKMPDVLSYEEIESIISSIDLSEATGQRNKTMIEVLYACGLRVSELIELKISNIFFEQLLIMVLAKKNNPRLVPIGEEALKQLRLYIEGVRRPMMNIQKGFEDHVFLNSRGKKISRVSVFNIVKEATSKAGIKKNVSPHTFRHSFATHLVAGGADLKAVQDMLGHESITTTEIYTHLDTRFLRETVLSFHPSNKHR